MDIPEDKENPEKLSPGLEDTGERENIIPEPSLADDFTSFEEDSTSSRLARRRRSRRMLIPPGEDDRATLLDDLSRRAFPSFEFFLFALLSGLVIAAGFVLDSPTLLVVGALVAPLLTPWVGFNLATMTGSWRFFFQTLASLMVAFLLVFLTGALAGLLVKFWTPPTLTNTYIHSHLWWPDLVLVCLGAGLLTISFVKSGKKAYLPSVLLAYEFFLPINAAGLGLINGDANSWPHGLLAFLVYLALATLTSCIVLAFMRFKPTRAGGYLLPIFIFVVSLAGVLSLTGFVDIIREGIISSRGTVATPTTMELPTLTLEVPPSNPSPSPTNKASLTPEITSTFTPTPAYAMINAAYGGGASVRSEPGKGTVVASLSNGSIVQVFPEIESVENIIWVLIRTSDGKDGWVLQGVLTATSMTPTPTITHTFTSTFTPSRTITPTP